MVVDDVMHNVIGSFRNVVYNLGFLVERIRPHICYNSALFDDKLKLGTIVPWYIITIFQPGDKSESSYFPHCDITKDTIKDKQWNNKNHTSLIDKNSKFGMYMYFVLKGM